MKKHMTVCIMVVILVAVGLIGNSQRTVVYAMDIDISADLGNVYGTLRFMELDMDGYCDVQNGMYIDINVDISRVSALRFERTSTQFQSTEREAGGNDYTISFQYMLNGNAGVIIGLQKVGMNVKKLYPYVGPDVTSQTYMSARGLYIGAIGGIRNHNSSVFGTVGFAPVMYINETDKISGTLHNGSYIDEQFSTEYRGGFLSYSLSLRKLLGSEGRWGLEVGVSGYVLQGDGGGYRDTFDYSNRRFIIGCFVQGR